MRRRRRLPLEEEPRRGFQAEIYREEGTKCDYLLARKESGAQERITREYHLPRVDAAKFLYKCTRRSVT